MKPARKVSVIVVNYNGRPHIDSCISSVLRQTYTDFDVVFVDNSSSDGSLSYVKVKFPGLIFVANDRNLGYAGGISNALAHCSGRYIAPLNVNTEVDPDWLLHMVRFLDENPRAGAVTPKVLLFDVRDRVNALGLNIHVSGLGFCRRLNTKDDGSSDPVRVPGVSGCSYLIRREIWERINRAIGQWDKDYDDVIVSWLTNLAGYETYCLPQAVVYHKYSLKMSADRLHLLERNRHSFLLSVLQPVTLFAYFPVFAATESLIAGYCLLKGKSYIQAKFRALTWVVRERRNIGQRRDQYRRLRKISDFALYKRLSWNLEWRQLLHTLGQHALDGSRATLEATVKGDHD